MANSFFQFKQFTVQQDACAMKVCTDACLFGAWCAHELRTAKKQTLLDIGAGTGLLSLMVLQKHDLYIDAVEIDEAAAVQAQHNFAVTPWNNNVTVHNTDVMHMSFLKSYDYIISNPPFYETDLKSPDNKRNTALHSHQMTLNQLCRILAANLKTDGTFFLLLPFKRSEEAIWLLAKNSLNVYKKVTVKQTPSHAPFRMLLKGGLEQKQIEDATITIQENIKTYTPEFTVLLKDYYLHL